MPHIEWEQRTYRQGESDVPSVAAYRARHPRREIVAIDGRTVEAWCEACGGPLFEGEKYDGDGEVNWHAGVYCPAPEAPHA